MNILYLGKNNNNILMLLVNTGNIIDYSENKLLPDPSFYDLIISFGYRYILNPNFINKCKRPPINLHISYLPWNRGADPNLWSHVDDTPKGVTIHEIDEGLDTGPIIYQKQVTFNDHDTLATSYEKLKTKIEGLFIENWPSIRDRTYATFTPAEKGTYHISKDKENILLPNGWSTKLSDVPRSKDVSTIHKT